MIFVSLGTQNKPFYRLLESVEKQIICGRITTDVIAQVGTTNYYSKYMEIIPYLPMDKFESYVKSSDLIICHAGYGILSLALESHKKIIAAARQVKYGEHVNDHQVQILSEYEKGKLLLALKDFSKLNELLEQIKLFTPASYIKNNTSLQLLISNFIQNN
jgi:UDP-N-acetylglucosamine transferase subunit ALG13